MHSVCLYTPVLWWLVSHVCHAQASMPHPQFKSKANKLKKKMWWQNVKLCAIILLVLFVIVCPVLPAPQVCLHGGLAVSTRHDLSWLPGFQQNSQLLPFCLCCCCGLLAAVCHCVIMLFWSAQKCLCVYHWTTPHATSCWACLSDSLQAMVILLIACKGFSSSGPCR
jgi:hypothetical protein